MQELRITFTEARQGSLRYSNLFLIPSYTHLSHSWFGNDSHVFLSPPVHKDAPIEYQLERDICTLT